VAADRRLTVSVATNRAQLAAIDHPDFARGARRHVADRDRRVIEIVDTTTRDGNQCG
jgi:hypothetical protein